MYSGDCVCLLDCEIQLSRSECTQHSQDVVVVTISVYTHALTLKYFYLVQVSYAKGQTALVNNDVIKGPLKVRTSIHTMFIHNSEYREIFCLLVPQNNFQLLANLVSGSLRITHVQYFLLCSCNC